MLTRIMNDSVTGCFFVKNQIKSILAAEEIELSLKTSCFQNFNGLTSQNPELSPQDVSLLPPVEQAYNLAY